MDKITEYLVNLATTLDAKRKIACADAIDSLTKSGSLVKLAQYVGVIGYVLKQHRAMANCIRNKRAQNSKTPYQEVVLSCLKEYQDGQSYRDQRWTSKYAEVVEQVPEQFEKAHLAFAEQLLTYNDIPACVTEVQKVAALLSDNQEPSELIDGILTSVAELHSNIKEEDPSRPFDRTAAVSPLQPMWWQRLYWDGRGRQQQGNWPWWMPNWDQSGPMGLTQLLSDTELLLQQLQTNINAVRKGVTRFAPIIAEAGSEADMAQIVAPFADPDLTDWNSLFQSVDYIRWNATELYRNYRTSPALRVVFDVTRTLQQARSRVIASFVRLHHRIEGLQQSPGIATASELGPPAHFEWMLLNMHLQEWEYNPFCDYCADNTILALELVTSIVHDRPLKIPPSERFDQYRDVPGVVDAQTGQIVAPDPEATPAATAPAIPKPPKAKRSRPPKQRDLQSSVAQLQRRFKREAQSLVKTFVAEHRDRATFGEHFNQWFDTEMRGLADDYLKSLLPDERRGPEIDAMKATAYEEAVAYLDKVLQPKRAPRPPRQRGERTSRATRSRGSFGPLYDRANLHRFLAVNATPEMEKAASTQVDLDEEAIRLLKEYIEDNSEELELPKFPSEAHPIKIENTEGTRKEGRYVVY